jgi:hypothetical protein
MITGYNTDVNHEQRVFHVQTEDKGTSNPYIESLIYVGGQVLAARRTDYAAVLAQGKGEATIIEIMDRQHRAMIAAITGGDYDEKVIELFGVKTPQVAREPSGARSASPPPIKPGAIADRSLDEVILEYLTSEAQQESLVLILDEGVELAIGEKSPIVVRATTSKSGEAVPGAEVSFRMISTVAEPKVLAKGTTDEGGRLRVEVEMPKIGEGSSALIITAMSPLGQAELKYLL